MGTVGPSASALKPGAESPSWGEGVEEGGATGAVVRKEGRSHEQRLAQRFWGGTGCSCFQEWGVSGVGVTCSAVGDAAAPGPWEGRAWGPGEDASPA